VITDQELLGSLYRNLASQTANPTDQLVISEAIEFFKVRYQEQLSLLTSILQRNPCHLTDSQIENIIEQIENYIRENDKFTVEHGYIKERN
jgi:hypothetical protein